jgi:uncharacterized protein (DUF433 family)
VKGSASVKSLKHHAYLNQTRGVCGGSPVIAGTRIRVVDIAVEYDRFGYSPDEIIRAHPELELEQIHDALSYYYENQKELDAEIRERLKMVEELKKGYPSVLKSRRGKN